MTRDKNCLNSVPCQVFASKLQLSSRSELAFHVEVELLYQACIMRQAKSKLVCLRNLGSQVNLTPLLGYY